jgi:RNA polymerase sigma-70 factor (ECF subfamily)
MASTGQLVFMTLENDHKPESGTSSAGFVEALVRDYQNALFGYARSLVRDEAAAQDIVQDTFLRLLQKPPAPDNARAWLFRVCRSRAIDWWRRRHAIPILENEGTTDFFERQPDEANTPDTAMLHTEAIGVLSQQLATLSPRQRELVRLKFQAGLSYKEIADTTGLTVTNVGFILHSTLATLRQRMETALSGASTTPAPGNN